MDAYNSTVIIQYNMTKSVTNTAECFLLQQRTDPISNSTILFLIILSSIIPISTITITIYFLYKLCKSSKPNKLNQPTVNLKFTFKILIIICTLLYLIETIVRPFMIYSYWICDYQMWFICGSTASPSKLLANILLLLLFIERLVESLRNSLFAISKCLHILLVCLVILFVLMIAAQQTIFYVFPFNEAVEIFYPIWYTHNTIWIIETMVVLRLFIHKFRQLSVLFGQNPTKYEKLVNTITKVKCYD